VLAGRAVGVKPVRTTCSCFILRGRDVKKIALPTIESILIVFIQYTSQLSFDKFFKNLSLNQKDYFYKAQGFLAEVNLHQGKLKAQLILNFTFFVFHGV
jgi:hypothetical protein